MTYVYLVKIWDDLGSPEYIDAVFLNKQEALEYAEQKELEHDWCIVVTQFVEGNPELLYLPEDIYKRHNYDHTIAAYEQFRWFPSYLDTFDDFVYYVEQKDVALENVDLHRLYKMYLESWAEDEDYDDR